jgi:hypothetical protein
LSISIVLREEKGPLDRVADENPLVTTDETSGFDPWGPLGYLRGFFGTE